MRAKDAGLQPRTRLPWIALAVVVLGLAAAPAVIDAWRVRSFRDAALRVQVGDSPERVREILGAPTATFERGSGLLDGIILGVLPMRPETWAYGRWFDWGGCLRSEFPYFNPVRPRLFGPNADDVRVEFDVGGKVFRVLRPGK
jgi:hypothetical protein